MRLSHETLPKAWQIESELAAQATALRQSLHSRPELSGRETATAATIANRMSRLTPKVITELGGTGLAAVFGEGNRTLLIRCELDALPIVEQSKQPYRSQIDGVAHLCGHDGHMAILYTVAHALARRAPDCRVVLLFQPAEETGAGARAVLQDPRFSELQADLAISLHNLPGLSTSTISLAAGAITCASRGLKIRLHGKSSHAAEPSKGRSPGLALAQLIPALGNLTNDVATSHPDFRLATVSHVSMGKPAFGITPGEAEIRVTLRTLRDENMAQLEKDARNLVALHASEFSPDFELDEVFSQGVNHPDAVSLLQNACSGFVNCSEILPMRFSEDFGLFGNAMPSAMLFLGSGEAQPALHNPDFDFPDALIPVGAEIFLKAIQLFEDKSD